MEQTSADPGVCGRFWVVELSFRGHPPDGRRRRGPGAPVSLGGRPEEGAAAGTRRTACGARRAVGVSGRADGPRRRHSGWHRRRPAGREDGGCRTAAGRTAGERRAWRNSTRPTVPPGEAAAGNTRVGRGHLTYARSLRSRVGQGIFPPRAMRPPGGRGRVTLPVPAGVSSGWRGKRGRGPESHDGAGRGVPLWSARWISRCADGGWRVATVRPVRLRGRVAADGVSNVHP